MAALPKATPNNNPFHENDNAVVLVKPKADALNEINIPARQAQRYQILAKHPEVVEQAK